MGRLKFEQDVRGSPLRLSGDDIDIAIAALFKGLMHIIAEGLGLDGLETL